MNKKQKLPKRSHDNQAKNQLFTGRKNTDYCLICSINLRSKPVSRLCVELQRLNSLDHREASRHVDSSQVLEISVSKLVVWLFEEVRYGFYLQGYVAYSRSSRRCKISN